MCCLVLPALRARLRRSDRHPDSSTQLTQSDSLLLWRTKGCQPKQSTMLCMYALCSKAAKRLMLQKAWPREISQDQTSPTPRLFGLLLAFCWQCPGSVHTCPHQHSNNQSKAACYVVIRVAECFRLRAHVVFALHLCPTTVCRERSSGIISCQVQIVKLRINSVQCVFIKAARHDIDKLRSPQPAMPLQIDRIA